jgi:addiction module HigA family antidote
VETNPRPVHPGVYLKEELFSLGLHAAAFARIIQVPTNRISEILAGRRAVTADTALRFGRFFGTSANSWMTLQSGYDLQMALVTTEKEIMALPTVSGLR